MGISLTENAANHVASFLAGRGKGVGIRLAVKTTGCSGLMYVLEPVDDPQPEDIKFDSNGVEVYVDPKSLVYVDGTEMDYVKEGLSEGFEFKNPNESAQCGCGESLALACAALSSPLSSLALQWRLAISPRAHTILTRTGRHVKSSRGGSLAVAQAAMMTSSRARSSG